MNAYKDLLKSVVQHWGLTFNRMRDDLAIAGSPERCLMRFVVEDDKGNLYILENVSSQNPARKEEIAGTLSFLSQQGMAEIHPYLVHEGKRFVASHDNHFWMLRPYVGGTALKRPEYAFDGWRGRAMAHFLRDLKEKYQGMKKDNQTVHLPITSFISDLRMKIAQNNPELLPAVVPIIQALEADFFAAHDRMPTGFCHGDFHPLNVIWSKDAILSVIDWELSGYNPEIYDAATLIGCLGMDDPEAMTGPFVQELLAGLAHVYDTKSFEYLLEFIISTRCACLSEWLRNGDTDIITLEISYMGLLIEQAPTLKDAWTRFLSD